MNGRVIEICMYIARHTNQIVATKDNQSNKSIKFVKISSWF